MMKHRAGRGGFTLIELLIVIAVISLLIAILLPAIGAARRRADALLCVTNGRTYAQMMAFYTSDNKETFPFVRDWGVALSADGSRVTGFAVNGTGPAGPQTRWLGGWEVAFLLTGRLPVYADFRWMYCPAAPQSKKFFPGAAFDRSVPDTSDIGKLPSYFYSEAFLRKPSYMSGKRTWMYATTWPLPPDYAVATYGAVRLNDVRFPSRKGVAYEITAWHSARYRQKKNNYEQPLDFFAVLGNENTTYTVPVADGSVQQKKMNEYQPGLNAGSVMVLQKLRVLQPPVDITVEGVSGYDW